jgi:hypothetical protein
LIAGLGPLAGCFSSTSASPPGDAETPEMEASPEMEAAVEAAAPGMEASVMDATVPMEAEVEASLPEAAVEAGPPPVKVTIANHLGPEPGVEIVLQDSAGNVVTTAVTDITGSVTLPLGNATQVTAIMGSGATAYNEESESVAITVDGVTVDAGVDASVPPANDVQIVTVQGVEPGDTLSLADPSDVTFSQATVYVDSVPDAGLPPATNYFQVQIGNCYGNGTPPIQVTLTSDCVSSTGQFPVFLSATGGPDAGYATLAYAWQTTPAFTVPLDGGSAYVDVTGAWTTETSAPTVTVTNLLSDTNAYAAYSLIADGVEFTPLSQPVSSGESTTSTTTFTAYPGYSTVAQSEVSITRYQSSWEGITAIATRGAYTPDAGPTIDVSTALPLISSLAYDAGTPMDDAGNPTGPGQPYVAWGTDAGSLASASGVVVQVGWTDYIVGGNNPTGTWTIVAPPTATSVTAPSLPAPYAGWAPNAASSVNYLPVIAIVQSDAAPTYTLFRNTFATFPVTSAFVTGYGSPPYIPALPANGTLKLTGITQNND